MTVIILGFILFCGTLLLGGTMGAADLKAKIEQGKVIVKTEQVITVVDADPGQQ